MGVKRWQDVGPPIGTLKPGRKNRITDVPGVLVGHTTCDKGPIKTGVTALLPHGDNLFQEKVLAAGHVFNGFGKTTGLMQVEELGTIETPILLTNTLSVGTVYQAVVEYMMRENKEIGGREGTVNPVVCECNDGYLNDIRGLHVTKEDVFTALQKAHQDFQEGGVGAGTGMCSFGLKGGIGSSSRLVSVGDEDFHLGVLVLSNFGRRKELVVNGKKIGPLLEDRIQEKERESKGSIIMILATDIPLSVRQLKRVARRVVVGLVHTGSCLDSGSGDVAIAFTTALRVPHHPEGPFLEQRVLVESYMDLLFQGAFEATEEAILNSLLSAHETTGRAGRSLFSLRDHLDLLGMVDRK